KFRAVENALFSLWRNGLSAQHRKHRGAHDGKEENRHRKTKRDDSHPALLKPARSIREEQYCGEQHGVGEILARNPASRASLPLTFSSLCGRFGGFAGSWCRVELGDKWMRISLWIFEGVLCDPSVISLTQLGRKAFHVKVQEVFVSGLMRSKRFHEHGRVNGCLLHALDRQHTCFTLQRVELIHQPIAFSSPRR